MVHVVKMCYKGINHISVGNELVQTRNI